MRICAYVHLQECDKNRLFLVVCANAQFKWEKIEKNRGMYFNYHAKLKKLIVDGHLVRFETLENYNGISPALVLYFDNAPPMPVREHKWEEYFKLIDKASGKV